MSYIMPIVLIPTGKARFVNAAGNTECVEFVRQATGAPQTSSWRKGIQVMGANEGDIKPYTAIATFDVNGRYPTDHLGKHAAIYLRHTATHIYVLDQWKKQGQVLERPIAFKPTKQTSRSNDGSWFYVID